MQVPKCDILKNVFFFFFHFFPKGEICIVNFIFRRFIFGTIFVSFFICLSN